MHHVIKGMTDGDLIKLNIMHMETEPKKGGVYLMAIAILLLITGVFWLSTRTASARYMQQEQARLDNTGINISARADITQ